MIETPTRQRAVSRREFLGVASLGAASLGVATAHTQDAWAEEKKIKGFDETDPGSLQRKAWTAISDRKIRVGIVGYGVCKFGAQFGFQDHPNVEVTAVSDLFADRCANLAKACRCEKTYPSLERMVKDDSIQAIFLATDAPSHARHAMLSMNHGKHVACAVPAVWGSLEQADELYETVKKTGLAYTMFETSAYRPDCQSPDFRVVQSSGSFGRRWCHWVARSYA